jgi:hypothetical protein
MNEATTACRHGSTTTLTATQGDGAIVTQWYCNDCGERLDFGAAITRGDENGTLLVLLGDVNDDPPSGWEKHT